MRYFHVLAGVDPPEFLSFGKAILCLLRGVAEGGIAMCQCGVRVRLNPGKSGSGLTTLGSVVAEYSTVAFT
jgi:hypothetical protein